MLRAIEHHSFRSAAGIGVRELLRRPKLSLPFLGVTLAQGVIQTLLIWTITNALRGTEPVWGAVLVLAIWSLRAWTAYLALVLAGKVAYQAEIEAMGGVLRSVLRKPLRFFEEHSSGDLVVSSYQDLSAIRLVTLDVAKMVLQVCRILALTVAAFLLSPKLALIGLACVPIVLFPAHKLGAAIKAAAKSERVRKAMLHDNFLQVVRGITSIKVNRAEWRILTKARSIADRLLWSMIQRAKHRGLSTFIMESSAGVGLALIIGFGGYEVQQGTLDWQSLIGILMAMVALYQPAIGFLASYNSICSGIPRLDKIERARGGPSRERGRPRRGNLKQPPKTITLENASFQFGDKPVLEDINLNFDQGETIGIVGQTGAGKSTLMELIMGLRTPTQGAVRYDGQDISDYRPSSLHEFMAFVAQEPTLFMDSVADNIRIGRAEASLEEVEAAGRDAQIHDEIERMEAGYETVVGDGRGPTDEEKPRGLSVGQKQRVSIAAAILKDAPLVFLDEATSSVDSKTEVLIQGATDKLVEGRTSFIVAHRLSTLRQATRIVVMQDGQVVGFAPHAELLKTCPTYRELWEAQSRHDEAGA